MIESEQSLTPQEQKHVGHIGWLIIGAIVVGWDRHIPDTITSAFRRGLENPKTRPLVVGATVATIAHLVGRIPKGWDPFDIISWRLGADKRDKGNPE